jgi:hypothetical protein
MLLNWLNYLQLLYDIRELFDVEKYESIALLLK